jgi:hypothetical protein
MENQHQDKPIWCFVGKITCHSKDEMAELDQALYGTMTARWQI